MANWNPVTPNGPILSLIRVKAIIIPFQPITIDALHCCGSRSVWRQQPINQASAASCPNISRRLHVLTVTLRKIGRERESERDKEFSRSKMCGKEEITNNDCKERRHHGSYRDQNKTFASLDFGHPNSTPAFLTNGRGRRGQTIFFLAIDDVWAIGLSIRWLILCQNCRPFPCHGLNHSLRIGLKIIRHLKPIPIKECVLFTD